MSDAVCRLPLKSAVTGETVLLRWAVMLCCFGFAIFAAVLAGLFPVQYSIAIVFLFAGPHNWFEARYFLTRLPPRLGKLRSFFCIAFVGTLGLTIAHAGMPWIAGHAQWSVEQWHLGLAIWSSMLIGWVTLLVSMRSRQGPRRDWSLAMPCALLVLSVAWLQPGLVLLSLVYLHPLVGLWILDREIRQRRPSIQSAYRVGLMMIPILVLWLAYQLAGSKPVSSGTDTESWLVMQAGGGQLTFVSSRFLVATHAFLETIHYGVWLIAIPLANRRVLNLSWDAMPITRRPGSKRALVKAFLLVGALLVITLWVAFCFDYPTTRSIYFNVAMIHVLTEIPFLLRLL